MTLVRNHVYGFRWVLAAGREGAARHYADPPASQRCASWAPSQGNEPPSASLAWSRAPPALGDAFPVRRRPSSSVAGPSRRSRGSTTTSLRPGATSAGAAARSSTGPATSSTAAADGQASIRNFPERCGAFPIRTDSASRFGAPPATPIWATFSRARDSRRATRDTASTRFLSASCPRAPRLRPCRRPERTTPSPTRGKTRAKVRDGLSPLASRGRARPRGGIRPT